MQTDWREHIESTPDVLRGKPRIKGTRIPVSLILGYLAAGNTAEEIIGEFPDLTQEQMPLVWITLVSCQNLRLPLHEIEVLCRPLRSQFYNPNAPKRRL